jgi:hypothetical protein
LAALAIDAAVLPADSERPRKTVRGRTNGTRPLASQGEKTLSMSSARIQTRPRAAWLAALTLAAFAALACAYEGTASAQSVADPDYWEGTAERQNTVNRFVYSHSPQAIPSSYDPVREAEEILRQRARALPPSNAQARAVWSQTQRVTAASRLAPALRSLGTIGLGVGVFELGWKIGTGINAKFLKIGLPEATDDINSYRWNQIRWTTARSQSHSGASWPAEDGWLIWIKQMCCAGVHTNRWFADPCPFNGFSPPSPFVVLAEAATTPCQTPDGPVAKVIQYGWAPEDALTPTGPIEPFAGQPADRSSSAGTAPPQSTVEQTIATELDKPENELLRDWLNYELGSPGSEDPLGIGQPRPDIDFPERDEKWRKHDGDFPVPHPDADEYWRDAADVIQKTEDGWPDFEKCRREHDNADIYWDPERQAIVIVREGVIENFFVPTNPDDPGDAGYARRYFDAACGT